MFKLLANMIKDCVMANIGNFKSSCDYNYKIKRIYDIQKFIKNFAFEF